MKIISSYPLFCLLVLCLLSSIACSPQKHLAPNQKLVAKNTITVDKSFNIGNKSLLTYTLGTMARQQPNDKIFRLFLFRLGVYNLFSKADSKGKFRKFIRYRIGEPPVIFDSLQMRKSCATMRIYMNNKGFYDAKVDSSVEYKGHKAFVTYSIKPGQPTIIDSVAFDSKDKNIQQLVRTQLGKETLIKKGNPFDVEVLNAERVRLAKGLKNLGYYYFLPNYILYEADTFRVAKKANVYVVILPFGDTATHRPYQVDSIIINPKGIDDSVLKYDTITMKNGNLMIYPHGEKPIIHSRAFNNILVLKPSKLWRYDDDRATNRNIRDLGMFRNASITYTRNATQKGLTANINLLPAKRMSYSVDADASAFQSNFGLSLGTSFKHNNLFKGAETLIVTGTIGGDLNINGNQNTGSNNSKAFSTFDTNIETSLYIPRSIALRHIPEKFNLTQFRTKINFRYSHLDRINFFRYNSYNANIGYEWMHNTRNTHSFSLFGASLLLPQVDAAYELVIQNSELLRNAFKPYVLFNVLGGYTWVYNGLSSGKPSGFTFRFHAENGGSWVYLFDKLIKPNERFQIPLFNSTEKADYSQYSLADLDLRYFKSLSKKTLLAARFFGGIGVPYGNSNALPYVRRYYAGGTNGIRAWTVRTLGPGSSLPADPALVRIDKTGDMRLEGNLEFRFPLIPYIYMEGAIFVDAGNIWALPNADVPDEERFHPSTFWKEIAVGTGAGVRFNFGFFILRLDIAFKVKRPYVVPDIPSIPYQDNYSHLRKHNPILNLAVGYPF